MGCMLGRGKLEKLIDAMCVTEFWVRDVPSMYVPSAENTYVFVSEKFVNEFDESVRTELQDKLQELFQGCVGIGAVSPTILIVEDARGLPRECKTTIVYVNGVWLDLCGVEIDKEIVKQFIADEMAEYNIDEIWVGSLRNIFNINCNNEYTFVSDDFTSRSGKLSDFECNLSNSLSNGTEYASVFVRAMATSSRWFGTMIARKSCIYKDGKWLV